MRKLLALGAALVVVGVIAFFVFREAGSASPEAATDTESAESAAASAARISEARQRIAGLAWSDVQLHESHGDRTLRGRVDAPDGSPVPGALVVATVAAAGETLSELTCECDNKCGMKLLACGCGEAHGQIVELVGERRGESIPVARALTREDGTFELTGLDDRALTLWAEKVGVGVGLKASVLPGTEVAIGLSAAKALDGKVVDEDGKPVGGAIVTAIFSEHSRFFDVVSDDAGNFSYPLLPAGSFRLVSVAEPLLPETEFAKAGETRFLKIEMTRPRFISGRVENAGVPVAGAQVALDGQHRKETATTDASGAFRFDGLRKGDYELVASHGGLKGRAQPELGKLDVVDVVIPLGTPRVIEGTVTGEDGAPIADARVWAWGEAKDIYTGSTSQDLRTDAKGNYRLEVFVDGPYSLRATAKGFLDGTERTEVAGEGATSRVDFRLKRGLELRGRVVDQGGRPVPNAKVSLRTDWEARARAVAASGQADDPMTGVPEPGSEETNETGEFTIGGLVAAHPYKYAVHADGFVTASGDITVPSPEVRWVLERGASITGLVLDAAGQPVADVEVYAEPIDKDGVVQVTRNTSSKTDANGHFALEGLEGEYLVLATRNTGPKERKSRTTATSRVRVTARQTAETVVRFEGVHELRGIALTGDGQPIAEVMLSLRPKNADAKRPFSDPRGWDGLASTDSREDGTFTFTGLREGPHVLTAWAKGHRPPEPIEVEVPARGDAPIEVRFGTQGKLVGRVVGEDGQPLTRFSIDLRPQSHPEGRFEIPVQRDGPVEVHIGAPGHATADRTFEGKRSKVVDVGEVRLERGRTLRGTVVNAAGAPVSGALVDVGPPGDANKGGLYLDEAYGAVKTNSAGRFELPNVSSQPRLLVVDHDGFPQHRQPLAPEVSEVTVTLRSGGTVRGTVALRDGRPAAGVGVVVTATTGFEEGRTGDDGTFTIHGVGAGPAQVLVEPVPHAPTYFSRTVEVREGEVTAVEFRPEEGSCDVALTLAGAVGRAQAVAMLVSAGTPPIQVFDESLATRSAAHTRLEDGRATFTAIPRGSYRLELVVMQQAGTSLVEVPVQVGNPCPPPLSVTLDGARPLKSPLDQVASDFE